MKPTSIRRRVIAALLVITFAFAFMEAAGGASGVRSPSPLERAAGVVAKKHCPRSRSKRGKKKRARRACRFRKAGLTPLVPPVRGSAVALGASGETGATGTTGNSWPGCFTTQCFVQPPCNALPYPHEDASGATGPWGVTGPDGPKVAYWRSGETRFIGLQGCAFDKAEQWEDMPPGRSVLLGDAGVRELWPSPLAPTLARLVVRVAAPGAPSAEVRLQYSNSTDRQTWTYLDGKDGPALSIATPGLKVSDWVDAPAAMAGPAAVLLAARIIGTGGDGATDPSFSGIALQEWGPAAYNP